MKESTKRLIDKASRAIEAAEILLENGLGEFSTGRAYYAMFYITEALLNEMNLCFSKHGGVHGAFGEHFIKTGLFDAKYHRWLLDAFDQRIEGDYGFDVLIVDQDALELIDQAKEFLHNKRRCHPGKNYDLRIIGNPPNEKARVAVLAGLMSARAWVY